MLGLLFRTTSTKTEKINLLIFITPRVVKTTQQVADLTMFKRHQMKEVDRRLTEAEEAIATAEYDFRAGDRKEIRAAMIRSGKVYSGPPAEATPVPPALAPSPAEAAPVPPAPAPSPAEKVTKSSSGSLLDKLPKISFSKKETEKKGTKAQKRGPKP